MYYSGIDLHFDNCYITTVGEADVVVKQQRVENIPEFISDFSMFLALANSQPSPSIWRSTVSNDLYPINTSSRFAA